MRIAELAGKLPVDEYGIHRGRSAAVLAYPVDGNERCFALEDGSFWFRHRNDCIVSAIRRFAPSGAILDVGGGNGFVTRRLLDEGFEAALLEPGPAGAFNAKTGRGIPTVICSTLEGADFPRSSVAAVGCFDVIEHIEDEQPFLDQVHRVLRDDGLFYGTAPAHPALWSQSDEDAGHFRRHSRRTISRLLQARFDLLYFTHFFACLTVPIFFVRTLPHLLGLSRKGGTLPPETEHGTGGGRLVGLLELCLGRESRRIAAGKVSRLGASCLFVARKTSVC